MTLWLMELGRLEGLERISTAEMTPEARRQHMRTLSQADSTYAELSASVGKMIAEMIQ